MTTRAEIERQLEEGYKEAHRLAIEEAEEFLKANGYYVSRLAEMSPVELSKREAKGLGVVFDSDKDPEEMEDRPKPPLETPAPDRWSK